MPQENELNDFVQAWDEATNGDPLRLSCAAQLGVLSLHPPTHDQPLAETDDVTDTREGHVREGPQNARP